MCDSKFPGIWSLSQWAGEMWADESYQDLTESVNHLTEQFSGFWFICWVSGCQGAACRASLGAHCDDWWHVTHLWPLSRCHVWLTSQSLMPGSGRGVAALYWRRHPASPGPGPAVQTVKPGDRQSAGEGSRGWDQAGSWGRLQRLERSHSRSGSREAGAL